jgi:hypothetical protein
MWMVFAVTMDHVINRVLVFKIEIERCFSMFMYLLMCSLRSFNNSRCLECSNETYIKLILAFVILNGLKNQKT